MQSESKASISDPNSFNFKELFQPPRDSRLIRHPPRTSVQAIVSCVDTGTFAHDDRTVATPRWQRGRASWVQTIARKKSGRQTFFDARIQSLEDLLE
ncbi:hypothetical protein BVI1335_530073 [Burkholderia vietnamiensis]|nr:hypothetical protein BVI1335_530073 [Burkholderia vietnamiensis]